MFPEFRQLSGMARAGQDESECAETRSRQRHPLLHSVRQGGTLTQGAPRAAQWVQALIRQTVRSSTAAMSFVIVATRIDA